jgi:predicted LPLAT superfamily acyltransferase
MALVALISGYFWMVDGERRAYSRAYLQRVFALSGRKAPSRRDTYLHFRSFAEKALDVFIAWLNPRQIGAVTLASPEIVEQASRDSRGALLIVCHHGNAELSRACFGGKFQHTIHPLVHTRHAQQYNAFLRAVQPDNVATPIEVEDIGVALELFAERIELPRHARQAAIAAHYAQWLEAQRLAYPYQFYNFYGFWSGGELAEPVSHSKALCDKN